jgi:lipoprotein-anchoring transpeptidase ErfK/SrfK
MDLAYVIERDAGVWAHPDDGERPAMTHSLFDKVSLSTAPAPAGWRAVAGGFMRASEVRAPERTARPAEVSPGERWIDVDTAREILTVYDGDEPIFVTLVSTGQGRPGTRYSTPRGVHRVEYKVPSAKMDNVDEGGDPPYSFEDVPWAQYFHKEVAIHGAYWHQRFGHPVSHGCVNLTPADAERVYALTRASTPAYPGTVVRVR